MPTPEDIAKQRELLAAHRRTLHVLLRQRASLGKDHISPGVAHGIFDARAEIIRIKRVLRGWGENVEDLPDDEEITQRITNPTSIPQKHDKVKSIVSKPFFGKGFSMLLSNQKLIRIIISSAILIIPLIIYSLLPISLVDNQSISPAATIFTEEVIATPKPSQLSAQARAMATLDAAQRKSHVQATVIFAATATAQAYIRDATISSSTAIAKADAARLDTLRQSGTFIANDDFSTNINNWFEGDTSDRKANKVINNGVLVMTFRDKNIYWYDLWQAEVQNFVAEIDIIAEVNNSGGGIIFGYQNKDNYYVAQMSRDGYFNVYRLQNGQKVELDAARYVSDFLYDDIKAANKLSVVRQGDDITIYINNVLVRSVRDNVFSVGEIGVMGFVFDNNGAVIQLDNFRLWKLP